MGKDHSHESLAFWQSRLTDQQMPVLAHTASAIVRHTAEDDSSAMELARVILQDASMTTRVLRMANSFYYNPGSGRITTISRAIVLLGFDAVRNICLSISLIDTFLRGPHRALAVVEMAHAFHAAVQAKSLAQLSRQKDPEEIFIATLLHNLGALAFWCFASGIDEELAERLRLATQTGAAREAVQRDVLGFRLQDLTAQLNHHWGLSPLLGQALDPRNPPNPRTRTIAFGHDIAHALAGDVGAPSLEQVLAEIERSLRIPAAEAQAQIASNAKAAAEAITLLGLPEAARLIPLGGTTSPKLSAKPVPTEEEKLADLEHAPSQTLQLEILRELAVLLEEPNPNINLMLEMVLEGIYRGVGMDRAVFALLTPDRKQVRAKFVLGSDREALKGSFAFAIGDARSNPIAYALQHGQTLWVGHSKEKDAALPRSPELDGISGGRYFLMPLSVAGKPIGCLYADRGSSGRPLDAELFAQFKLFGNQARMGLSYLKAG